MGRSIWNQLLKGSAIFVTLATAGCGGNAPGVENQTSNVTNNTANSATSGAERKTVRIGFSPNIVQPQPILLQANPKYAALGPNLKFEFKAHQAGPAVIEALRAGTIDVGYSGTLPPLKAWAKAQDIVILAGATDGGTGLTVLKNSPIKSVKDLKGKTVGINQLGSMVDGLVRYTLIQNNLLPDRDVKIQPIEPALQAEALKRGLAAAVAAPAPWPSQVEISGNGRTLVSWKDIFNDGKYASAVLYTTRKIADSNPELIKEYVALHRKITDTINADRTKGDADILQAWQAVSKKKLSPEIARAAFKTITFTNDPNPTGIDRTADLMVKTGIAKKKPDLKGFVREF